MFENELLDIGFLEVNGKYLPVGNWNQLYDIIESNCGHETSDLIRNIVKNADQNEIYARERLWSDMDAYEEELDEWSAIKESILDCLSEYEEYDACHKNLNRERIDQMKKRIRTLLDNVM